MSQQILTLCEIARKTLEASLEGKEFQPNEKTKKKFSEKKACFVTLSINDELRGCVGCLETNQELWKNIQENAISAAFNDYRFLPIKKKEIKGIKIEVSVLSRPKLINHKDEKDLLIKINNKMGIILKGNPGSATFLPQVWEQLPDKTEFFEHLSLKAGLNKDAWKNPKTEFWCYGVDADKEKD